MTEKNKNKVCDINTVKEKRGNYTYSLCLWTDRTDFLLNETEKLTDTDNLLEIRCFGDNGEFYAFRSDVMKDRFSWREKSDAEKPENCFEESHYLDIDDAKTKNENDGYTYATGGGKYHLPVKNAEKLIVRFYYKFDANGIARKTDWRIVGFETKEGK